MAEFDRPDLSQDCRLPPIRHIASHLKVSSRTVQGVFRRLAQQGRIRSAVGNGTFLVSASRRPTDRITIALGIPVPGRGRTEEWVHRIYGGMLNAVMGVRQPITLLPLPQDDPDVEIESRRLLEERSKVDGLILFPCSYSDKVRATYERDRRFVVDVNPATENTTANFVSPDYFSASRRLAAAWRASGRHQLMFLTTPMRQSVSSRLRCAGFVAGLESAIGKDVLFRVVEASSWREDHGYEAMKQTLVAAHASPDAIYCAGDGLAVGALKALTEHGLRAPGDVSIAGGTGLHMTEALWPRLTRTQQPLERIGEELVRMVLQRIEQKGASLPGLVLETPFVGGATTRPEENEFLGIKSAQADLHAVGSREDKGGSS